MAGVLNAPQFSGRVPIQFLSAENPSLNVTGSNALFNNPSIFQVSAGNVAKIIPAIDGTTKISGQGEYAPFALDLEWAQMGFNDYLKLAALQPYLLTFITFRGIGYYGRLVLPGPGNDKPYSADVVKVKATFLVLGPSDAGGAAAVTRIATPTSLSVSNSNSGGFIVHGTKLYYFLTFKTIWGETDSQVVSITAGSSGTSWQNSLTWSWPTGTGHGYCTMACLYVGTSSNINQAVLMAEILQTDTASWPDLVGFAGCSPPGVAIYQTPPSVNSAYAGKFQGGLWTNP